MISFEELRKVDPALRDVSDEELERIRDLLYAQARLALGCWFEEKKGFQKIPLGCSLSEVEMPELKQCKLKKRKTE
jgi:hypothetical protein